MLGVERVDCTRAAAYPSWNAWPLRQREEQRECCRRARARVERRRQRSDSWTNGEICAGCKRLFALLAVLESVSVAAELARPPSWRRPHRRAVPRPWISTSASTAATTTACCSCSPRAVRPCNYHRRGVGCISLTRYARCVTAMAKPSANPNHVFEDGSRLLHHAAYLGNVDCMQALLTDVRGRIAPHRAKRAET